MVRQAGSVGQGGAWSDVVSLGRQGMVECGVVVKGMVRQAWFGSVGCLWVWFGAVRFGRLGMVLIWFGFMRFIKAGVTGYGRIGSGLVCFGRSGEAR